MKKKIEIKSIFDKVLFELEKENNTIKETLEEAVKRGANLAGAYLVGANLVDAYLAGAYLVDANLAGAYLEGAYLVDANLVGANLAGANLVGANLVGANLEGGNFGDWGKLQSISDILIVGSIGSRNEYTSIFHTDKGVFVQCGCFRGTIEEFEKKVKETHHGNNYERDYLAMIEFAKVKFELTAK